MLHYLSFAVANLARSAAFYDATLSELGYVRVWADDSAVGYGLPGGSDKFASSSGQVELLCLSKVSIWLSLRHPGKL